jgi:hypothetical protein
VIGIIGTARKDGKTSFGTLIKYCAKDNRAAYVGMQNIHFPESAGEEMASLAFENPRCKDPLMHVIQSGATLKLSDEYGAVVERFLGDGALHPNTRNDMRWVAHKYFKWLEDEGHTKLTDVGAEQIQKFMLHCSKQMTPTSMHNVKLHICNHLGSG